MTRRTMSWMISGITYQSSDSKLILEINGLMNFLYKSVFNKHDISNILTCKSMDAFAQRTPLLMDENPFAKVTPVILLGDEFIRIVTSSMPSFPIMVHPSSVNPLSASLKPLQISIHKAQTCIRSMNKYNNKKMIQRNDYLHSLWPRARKAAGRLPQAVAVEGETSCAICLSCRIA